MGSQHITADDVIAAATISLSSADTALLRRACAYAREKHSGQTRYSGLPYYTHPFEVGKLLAEIGMAAAVIAAGVLHDTIEDTDTTVSDLTEAFGEEIAFFVDSVSHLGSVRYQGLDARTTSLQKLFLATGRDLRVVIIKLMDRLHNMRTLDAVPREKQSRIAKETRHVYAPLADRLGMGTLKTELDELAFKHIDFATYSSLKAEIDALLGDVSTETIERQVGKALSSASVPVVAITSRVKSVYSAHMKMLRKKYSLNQVQDLVALRVIVADIPTAYSALGILHAEWHSIPGALKDYISLPKPNGYQALHTRVIVDSRVIEIQILTRAMHEHSRFGVAAHFRYKERLHGIAGLKTRWLNKLLGSPRSPNSDSWKGHALSYAGDRARFLENIKSDFLQERMFIFTPKGETVDLPLKATVADFAFAIHSDIGSRAEGALVNGKYVSLRHTLHNGDVVEVKTGKKVTATAKWLDWIKTTEARSRIRKVIKKSS